MKPPAFTLRVHTYEENRQDGTRTLVSYTPFLRMGAPGVSGHSGEVVYLQHGYVYGEGGDPYDVEDLPAWFAAALAALTPQARADVGFTADRVRWYTGVGQGVGSGAGGVGSGDRAGSGEWAVGSGGSESPPSSLLPTPYSPLPTPFLPTPYSPLPTPHSLLPTSPTWKLGWLCKQGHDYQGTGMSRYDKRMRCVDCEHDRKRKQPGVARRAPAPAPGAAG